MKTRTCTAAHRRCESRRAPDPAIRDARNGRQAEARRGSPVDRLYIGTRRIGTQAEASGPQLRNARNASAKLEVDEAPAPTVASGDGATRGYFPLEASVRRGWGESSKRSSASVGADAPFRGQALARCPAGSPLLGPEAMADRKTRRYRKRSSAPQRAGWLSRATREPKRPRFRAGRLWLTGASASRARGRSGRAPPRVRPRRRAFR